MRFGNCPNCGEYKYLSPERGICPSCKEDMLEEIRDEAFAENQRECVKFVHLARKYGRPSYNICFGTRPDGERCNRIVGEGSRYCEHHDQGEPHPSVAPEERRLARPQRFNKGDSV